MTQLTRYELDTVVKPGISNFGKLTIKEVPDEAKLTVVIVNPEDIRTDEFTDIIDWKNRMNVYSIGDYGFEMFWAAILINAVRKAKKEGGEADISDMFNFEYIANDNSSFKNEDLSSNRSKMIEDLFEVISSSENVYRIRA